MRGIISPEPDPMPNGGIAVWNKVIEFINEKDFKDEMIVVSNKIISDMKERNQFGIEKYGTPLQAFNGRNSLIDAYQELLDGMVYIEQSYIERKIDKTIKEYIMSDLMWALIEIRMIIDREKNE